jgi:AAA+ ATPase superfamily predicted ATPase
MKRPENPFYTLSYKSEHYFCDRKIELDRLYKNAINRTNTTLISARKYGKSALIHRLFEELAKGKEWICVYIDIYSTQNLKELTELLAANILKKFPEKVSIGKRFMEFLKGLHPVISYDILTGQPEVRFEFSQVRGYERTLEALLRFLDEQNLPALVAIDEFQQVVNYTEKNTEAVLRTIIQTLHNVQFIFSGSNQHLMIEIFNSAKRPFFSSTQSLSLQEIPKDDYSTFIKLHFSEGNRVIDNETIEFILEWTCRHTYYTQFVCNKLYASQLKIATLSDTKLICSQILEAEKSTFLQYRNLLTYFQWHLLKAIAKEEKVLQPQSKQFLQKYKLGAASTVKKALDALITKEMILLKTEKDESLYRIYDIFLMRWLQTTY